MKYTNKVSSVALVCALVLSNVAMAASEGLRASDVTTLSSSRLARAVAVASRGVSSCGQWINRHKVGLATTATVAAALYALHNHVVVGNALASHMPASWNTYFAGSKSGTGTATQCIKNNVEGNRLTDAINTFLDGYDRHVAPTVSSIAALPGYVGDHLPFYSSASYNQVKAERDLLGKVMESAKQPDAELPHLYSAEGSTVDRAIHTMNTDTDAHNAAIKVMLPGYDANATAAKNPAVKLSPMYKGTAEVATKAIETMMTVPAEVVPAVDPAAAAAAQAVAQKHDALKVLLTKQVANTCDGKLATCSLSQLAQLAQHPTATPELRYAASELLAAHVVCPN